MDTNDQPKKIGLVWPLIIVACVLGSVVAVGLMIGHTEVERSARIDKLATIMTSAVALSLWTIALSFPIRQWRRKDVTGEVEHHYHDGTTRVREIHYGVPPKYIGGQTQTDPMQYPAMVTAAYRAGAAPQPAGVSIQPAPYDLPPEAYQGDDDIMPPVGWDGEIVM